MSNFDPTPYRPRNPVTHQRHKHEVRWQITLPIAIGVLIVLVAAFLVVTQTTFGEASKMADISLIWLIIPTMFFALIGTVVVGGLAYLIIRLIAVLPYQFYRLQNLLLQVHRVVVQVGDKLAAPVIKVNTWKASYDQLRGRSISTRRYR